MNSDDIIQVRWKNSGMESLSTPLSNSIGTERIMNLQQDRQISKKKKKKKGIKFYSLY